VVVGGDHHRVHPRRGGRSSIDVLDHGTTRNIGQRLTRKARGVVPGGDDGDGVQRLRRTFERTSERDWRHGE
jgi:hypothetical protein